jgi:hypothetical protein
MALEPVPDRAEAGEERRSSRRYPLVAEVEYVLFDRWLTLRHGRGHTVNISSGGALLESMEGGDAGLKIELNVRFGGARKSSLCAVGRVVRVNNSRMAVKFERRLLSAQLQGSIGDISGGSWKVQ